MDLFEFIAGMISVILALVLAQLFLGLAHVVQARAKVRPSLLHGSWVLVLFLITFQHWWSLWDFRDLAWTFPAVLFSMSIPSLLFFTATLISPHDTPEGDLDLGEHFEHVRRPMLAVFLVGVILGSADGLILGTEELFNRLRIQQLVFILAAATVLVSNNRTVQRAATLVVTVAAVAGILIRFLPGVIA